MGNIVVEDDYYLCVACLSCVSVCPTGAIGQASVNNYIKNIYIDSDACICCGICAGWCPWKIIGRVLSVYKCPSIGWGAGSDFGDHWGDDSGNNGGETGGAGGNNDSETNLGREGLEKIRNTLQNGNVKVKQVGMSNGNAVLTAVGIGANANGLIASCLNFMDQANLDKYAKGFGNALGGLGVGIGLAQTYIAWSDGEITTGDILSAVSTALGAIGLVGAFVPAVVTISGIAGVIACVIG